MGAQGLFILGFSLSVEVVNILIKFYNILIIQQQTNQFDIRLLECVKVFLACPGSPTKSSPQSSSTSHLPSARSQSIHVIISHDGSEILVLQSPCCNFHPHPLCPQTGGSKMHVFCWSQSFLFAKCHVRPSWLCWHCLSMISKFSFVKCFFQALLTLLAWALPQWRQLQLMMAGISLLLVSKTSSF